MRWLAPLSLLFAAGCGAEAPAGKAASGLTGLYEDGTGPRRNQLCLIEREGGGIGFGLIVWGHGDANCSASGSARRDGGRLRLSPDGEEACAFDAQVEDGRIALSAMSPQCARYYCGPGGDLNGAAFERSNDDAAAARDLAGDRLCAE